MIDGLLASLDQWAGPPLHSRSIWRRRLAYGAWFLFVTSLILPTLYSGPVLTASSSTNLGLVVCLGSFISFIAIPIMVIRAIVEGFIGSSPASGNLMRLIYFQLGIHAIGNLLLSFGAWIPFNEKTSRFILYLCTFLGMSVVVNPVYDVGPNLRIGYYVWVMAHIILSVSTFVK